VRFNRRSRRQAALVRLKSTYRDLKPIDASRSRAPTAILHFVRDFQLQEASLHPHDERQTLGGATAARHRQLLSSPVWPITSLDKYMKDSSRFDGRPKEEQPWTFT
jgi:hypothetical protein